MYPTSFAVIACFAVCKLPLLIPPVLPKYTAWITFMQWLWDIWMEKEVGIYVSRWCKLSRDLLKVYQHKGRCMRHSLRRVATEFGAVDCAYQVPD